jgi:hypothetical protein
MSLEFTPENRNANIVVRRCSFCRRPGHNITRCNSETIHIFERNIFAFIQRVISERQDNILIMASLRHYLLNEAIQYPSLVRAFAISRCGAHSRSNMDHCIIVIIQYFMMELIHHTETNNQLDIEEEIFQEESQLGNQLQERGTQIEFSQLGIRELIENETNLYASMFADIIRFIDIVRRMSETSEINRKFQIKTKISDNLDNLEEKCECNICYEECERKIFVKLDCGHEFCKDCIRQSLQNEQRQTPCCAFCRANITILELKSESIKNELNDFIIT